MVRENCVYRAKKLGFLLHLNQYSKDIGNKLLFLKERMVKNIPSTSSFIYNRVIYGEFMKLIIPISSSI